MEGKKKVISLGALRSQQWRMKRKHDFGDEVAKKVNAIRVRLQKEAEKAQVQVDDNIDDDIFNEEYKECGNEMQEHLVFKHPFTCLIAGPTQSGIKFFLIFSIINLLSLRLL